MNLLGKLLAKQMSSFCLIVFVPHRAERSSAEMARTNLASKGSIYKARLNTLSPPALGNKTPDKNRATTVMGLTRPRTFQGTFVCPPGREALKPTSRGSWGEMKRGYLGRMPSTNYSASTPLD
jgi:hypothetical protein